jgi:hypothetical protein
MHCTSGHDVAQNATSATKQLHFLLHGTTEQEAVASRRHDDHHLEVLARSPVPHERAQFDILAHQPSIPRRFGDTIHREAEVVRTVVLRSSAGQRGRNHAETTVAAEHTLILGAEATLAA